MPDNTPAFSEDGVRELNGFRLYAKMSGMSGDRAKQLWDRLPGEIQERWREKAASVRVPNTVSAL